MHPDQRPEPPYQAPFDVNEQAKLSPDAPVAGKLCSFVFFLIVRCVYFSSELVFLLLFLSTGLLQVNTAHRVILSDLSVSDVAGAAVLPGSGMVRLFTLSKENIRQRISSSVRPSTETHTKS